MKDFTKLIQGVVCSRKNNGYKMHRVYINQENKHYFTKSLEISKTDVLIAENILKILSVNTKEDFFLGLTCVSLLSSYEKREKLKAKFAQDDVKESKAADNLYYYKGMVNKLIKDALEKDLDFTFSIDHDAKGLDVTYITLAGVQFSFHSANASETAKRAMENGDRQYQEQEWDKNFAFQNGAKEVFEFALHLKKTSKLDYIYETPLEYATSLRSMEKGKELNGE